MVWIIGTGSSRGQFHTLAYLLVHAYANRCVGWVIWPRERNWRVTVTQQIRIHLWPVVRVAPVQCCPTVVSQTLQTARVPTARPLTRIASKVNFLSNLSCGQWSRVSVNRPVFNPVSYLDTSEAQKATFCVGVHFHSRCKFQLEVHAIFRASNFRILLSYPMYRRRVVCKEDLCKKN